MHIFLTGDIQVGKTTVIRNFLSRSGLSADGFMTYWESDSDGRRSLYLAPYNSDLRADKKYLIARDGSQRLLRAEDMKSVFDIHGVEMLNNSGTCNVTVMDELGFLESEAYAFQNAVFERIAGDAPILGVIRSRQTAFLDALRSHPDVETRDVTAENRDAVLNWLLSKRERSLL